MTKESAICLIRQMACPPYEIACGVCTNDQIYIDSQRKVVDVITGEDGFLRNRVLIKPMLYDQAALVAAVFRFLKKTAVHEVEEWFSLAGERIYNPHAKSKGAIR